MSVDLVKVYYKAMREELMFSMRESGVAEKYDRLVMNMYESSMAVVRCAVGVTDGFKVEVGLHQRSGLSPLLLLR